MDGRTIILNVLIGSLCGFARKNDPEESLSKNEPPAGKRLQKGDEPRMGIQKISAD